MIGSFFHSWDINKLSRIAPTNQASRQVLGIEEDKTITNCVLCYEGQNKQTNKHGISLGYLFHFKGNIF